MRDRISVAMATYNGENFLREQLDSIYSQTYLPYEVIVTDDCSSDGTISILEEYRIKYGLKYYINEKNIGYNKNFEKAISLCSGNYFALSDQDDVWLPNKIELTYKKLKEIEKGMPAVVATNSFDVDPSLNVIGSRIIEDKYWQDALWGVPSQGCSMIFNLELKEKVLPIPDGIIYDGYIALTAAMIGNWFRIGTPLLLYRHHNNNVLAKYEKVKFKEKLSQILEQQYPFLISNQRFINMAIIRDFQLDNFLQNKKKLFDSIYELQSFHGMKKCKKILQLKYFPFKTRIKSLLFYGISNIARTLGFTQKPN